MESFPNLIHYIIRNGYTFTAMNLVMLCIPLLSLNGSTFHINDFSLGHEVNLTISEYYGILENDENIYPQMFQNPTNRYANFDDSKKK